MCAAAVGAAEVSTSATSGGLTKEKELQSDVLFKISINTYFLCYVNCLCNTLSVI